MTPQPKIDDSTNVPRLRKRRIVRRKTVQPRPLSGAVVATQNDRDFATAPGLTVENWLA